MSLVFDTSISRDNLPEFKAFLRASREQEARLIPQWDEERRASGLATISRVEMAVDNRLDMLHQRIQTFERYHGLLPPISRWSAEAEAFVDVPEEVPPTQTGRRFW